MRTLTACVLGVVPLLAHPTPEPAPEDCPITCQATALKPPGIGTLPAGVTFFLDTTDPPTDGKAAEGCTTCPGDSCRAPTLLTISAHGSGWRMRFSLDGANWNGEYSLYSRAGFVDRNLQGRREC